MILGKSALAMAAMLTLGIFNEGMNPMSEPGPSKPSNKKKHGPRGKQYGTRSASINRNTGNPHEGNREAARRMKQMTKQA